jgi:hypothetical protein
MPMTLGTDRGGASDSASHPTHADEGRAFPPTTQGIRLSDILNLRVGCWSPAVYVESLRKSEV